jgi:molecular chaperone HscA
VTAAAIKDEEDSGLSSQTSGPTSADGFIALDFGTSASRMAYARGEAVHHVKALTGDVHIPTVLAMSSHGGLLAGTPARDRQVLFPAETVLGLKSLLTLSAEELASREPFCPQERVEPAGTVLQLKLGGRDRTVIEIAAHYLAYLRRSAEIQLERPVYSAVLCVPLSFTSFDRQSLLLAAQLAGFQRIRFIEDTTAAALAWAAQGGRGRAVVCCWGATYLSMAVVEIGDRLVRIRTTWGCSDMGGERIDLGLARELLAQVKEINPKFAMEPHVARRIQTWVEGAKRDIAKRGKAELQLAIGGGRSAKLAFTADDLERHVAPLRAQGAKAAAGLLAMANLGRLDLDTLVLTGGMTAIESIRDSFSKSFDRTPVSGIDPEQAVVEGALMRVRLLDREVSSPLVLDAMSYGHGLRGGDETVSAILPCGVVLPASIREVFATVLDRQTQIGVPLYARQSVDWEEVALVEISKIPPMDAGQAVIEVAFKLDENGILSVEATEMTKSKKLQTVIRPKRGLTSAAIEAALENLPAPPAEDAAEELIRDELRQRARYWLESLKELTKRRASLMTRDEKQLTDKKARELTEVMEAGADLVEMRLCLQEMQEVVRPLVQRDVDASLQAALQ